LAQAAVESVSLFDGPRQEPHLHMATSPLVESVRPFAPEGVLFGPDGREVMRYPPPLASHPTERLLPGKVGAAPTLSNRFRAGARVRALQVSVASPSAAPYTLLLTAQLAQIDSATSTVRRLMLGALLIAGLVLVAVQVFHARSLARRLGELKRHAEALRAGDFNEALTPERQGDELAALRDVLTQATLALKRGRAAKERLLADAAHELRTPLTLMRTSLDLALRRERPVAELLAALRDTRDEVDRLGALATKLLDVASLAHENPPHEAHDVSAIVREAVTAAAAEAARRGLHVQLEAATDVVAHVHAEAVRRALDNLLSNALKYAQHEIAVSLEASAQQLVLRVRDDGPGIPEAERELVFEPFHRVRGGAPGTGLGLAIVREVASAHGGIAGVVPTAQGAELMLTLARGA
jgi:signal transduction histidine kinase